ncbi:MAG: peroxiredoxin Q/BCP [Myxococcota bacterium]|jgi:peroxiredoxin Q/BCP
MVSLDYAEKNDAFAKSIDCNFPILSDSTKEVAKAYGVLGVAGLYAKRWTFYIDVDGTVRAIDQSVRVSRAGDDLAERLDELGFPRRSA